VVLDIDDLDQLAERVADLVVARLRADEKSPDRWLDSKEAADHLGISLHALRHLTARRALPFAQDAPGSKMFFRASELDAWRADQAHEQRI
jgi:excisionase family DNA binding protein